MSDEQGTNIPVNPGDEFVPRTRREMREWRARQTAAFGEADAAEAPPPTEPVAQVTGAAPEADAAPELDEVLEFIEIVESGDVTEIIDVVEVIEVAPEPAPVSEPVAQTAPVIEIVEPVREAADEATPEASDQPVTDVTPVVPVRRPTLPKSAATRASRKAAEADAAERAADESVEKPSEQVEEVAAEPTPKKATAKKPTPKKANAEKADEQTKTNSPSKATELKPAESKPPTTKTPARKTASTKSATKTDTAQKTPAKKPAATKPAAKKTPAKQAPAKKATPAKKADAPKKAPATKTPKTADAAAAAVKQTAAVAKPTRTSHFTAAAYASAGAAAIAEAAARVAQLAATVAPTTSSSLFDSPAVVARATSRDAEDAANNTRSATDQQPATSPAETLSVAAAASDSLTRPDTGAIPRTATGSIARVTTGSIAKYRPVTGAIDTINPASGAIDTAALQNLKPDTAARLDALTGPIELPTQRRKRRRRRVLTIALASALALLVVAGAVGGWAWWMVTRSFPQTDGTIAVAGLNDAVTVQRDSAGIATITAQNPTDLFYAQGYVHAQERFWEMDVRRHITSGTLSEMFGASEVETDKFLRALGWHHIAQQEYELLSDTDRSYYQAYADGVNAYLAENKGADASLEYALLGMSVGGYEPAEWQPTDSIAWLKAMAWDLRSNLEDEISRALLAQELPLEQIAAVYPDYPFTENPAIVSSSTPIPTNGFVIGGEPEEEEPEPTPEPEPTATPTPEASETPAEPTETPSDATVDGNAAGSDVELLAASDSSVLERVDTLLAGYGEGIGSNSWVISGRLTESGKPLLANDPHLGAALPSVWTQLHLRCEETSTDCPFDVAGFSFAGLPGIIIGHNDDIAWGLTNLTTDVTDLYIGRVDENGAERYGSVMQPLEERTETINVAGGNPVNFTVRTSVNGPILSDFEPNLAKIAEDPYISVGNVSDIASSDAALPPYQMVHRAENVYGAPEPGEWVVSLRWTALDVTTTPQSIFALNTAKNFDEFRAAARLFAVPAQALIYADVEGNIGYQTPGQQPVRAGGSDGWMPQPGWSPDYTWSNYIDFEELPVVYNPASGYIVTANNSVVTGAESAALTRDWDHGYRAARIVRLVEETIAAGKVTPEAMAAVQNDERMWIGPRVARAFKDIAVPDDLKPIIEELELWDGQNRADSSQAAYANVLWNRLALNLFQERDVPLPVGGQSRLFTVVDGLLNDPSADLWQNEKLGVASMDEMLVKSAQQARDELVALQGEDRTKWNWGDLHALKLTHETLGTAEIFGMDRLFNRGPYPVGGGGSVVNATGWTVGDGFATVTVPSMRMVVDLANFDNSTWINLTGQSGHTFHPNYTDQTAEWAVGLQRKWPFTPEAVAESTTATLTLEPK